MLTNNFGVILTNNALLETIKLEKIFEQYLYVPSIKQYLLNYKINTHDTNTETYTSITNGFIDVEMKGLVDLHSMIVYNIIDKILLIHNNGQAKEFLILFDKYECLYNNNISKLKYNILIK